MRYPKNIKAIVDVTKPPYNCDNTGGTDCTEALCRAFDDILRPNIDGIQKALDKLNASDDPNYRISFEICKKEGVPSVIFPEDLESAKILYFPKGTYLVSDTISHSLENLKNILNGVPTMEINRQIYIVGESKEDTVIKLRDNCPGFGFGCQKPIISYIRTEKSNIAMTNLISDITIDCGSGNSGAVGLVFYSNNSGAVRNVTIKSTDPEYRGYCGLLVDRPMEGYIKDLTVSGFDYGVKIDKCSQPVVCEDIKVDNQNVTGFFVQDANVPVYRLQSQNRVTPFRVDGVSALAALIDAKCIGGDPLVSAIVIASGEAYLRNVTTEGYRWPLIIGKECHHFDPYISEVSTSRKMYTLFENSGLSLNLEIEDAPADYLPGDVSEIAFVDDYGAVGDGVTDNTDAIQAAMNSGKPCVYFGTGHYLVDGSVTVPASVKLIDFMYCDFYSGEKLKNAEGQGFLRINEDSESHITLKSVFSWEKFYGWFRFIDHNCKRTVVLKDLHTQCAGMYFNSVEGGKLFVENCACTMGGGDYCTVSPFEFKGQQVWCRNINPERGDVQILNDNSKLWILGMKTETHVGRFASTAIKNINGGCVECFGVNSGIGRPDIPLYINDNSDMSLYFRCANWDILVREINGGEAKELYFDDAQPLTWFTCRVPGYIGKRFQEGF